MDAEMSNKTDEPASPAESDDDDDPVQTEQAEVTDALAKEANKLDDDKRASKLSDPPVQDQDQQMESPKV